MLEVCRAFMRTIETVTAITAEERNEAQKKELSHAFGGLRVALHLIRPIITAKPLLESGQTPLLATPDKKDTDPDYFEAHNFLVKLRVAILPLLRDLWQAPWLISAPLYVSKAVVQVVLEVTNEEGEDRGAPPNIEGGPAPNNGPSRRPGPDETQVQTLIDMGFPRSAAERALSRTGNNLSAATEILLSHPFPLPPDPDPELEVTTTEPPLEEHVADADGAEVGLVQMEDVAPTPGEGMTSEEPPSPPAEIPVVVGRSAEQWRKELDEAREPLRAGLSRQALLLIDEHVSLLFDLRAVFLRPNNAHLKQAIQELVDDIKAFSPFAYDVQEQPLANRCRLIALVLSESPSLFNQETRSTLMDSLLALLLSSIDPEHPPRWLATHLLVTEALFTLAAEPRAVAVPKEGEPIVVEAITVGPPLKGAKAIVFDFCLRLLAVSDLPTDEWLSILRLFVLLTRDYDMALQFMKSDGLSMLLSRVKASAVPGSSTYIAIILRHIVEDPLTLRNIMQHTIKRYFEQPRTRSVDVGTYVRSCNSMALRNPDVFLEVTESLCQLGDPYLSPHISLKAHSPVADEQPAQKTEAEGTSDMQIDEPSTSISGGAVESMIFQLINELMSTMKTIVETPRTAAEGPPSRLPTLNAGPTDDIATDVGDSAVPTSSTVLYDYGCFLMQCLTELLFSYDSCKLAFLSYSPKKRGQTPSKETGSKYRTATLQFLLSDLVTFGTINPQPDERARNRITLCNWAMSVLVALCVDSAPNHEVKEVSADLVSVRKFVLEAVSRAIKDLPPSDNLEARYGRLLALADLCHRLLIVRFNATSNKQQDENPTHIAKVMLEKNFVATLTTALSEIDLNYPHVRGLVPSVLRPLQYL
jgi:E3 ubiquitin-protein ligase HUWE1